MTGKSGIELIRPIYHIYSTCDTLREVVKIGIEKLIKDKKCQTHALEV
jgi:hypothetical protein